MAIALLLEMQRTHYESQVWCSSLEIINSTCSQQGFFMKLDNMGNPIYGNSFRGCGPLGLLYEIKANNCLLALGGNITISSQPLYYNNDSLFCYGAVDGIAIVEDECNLSSGNEELFNPTSLTYPNPIYSQVTFRNETKINENCYYTIIVVKK